MVVARVLHDFPGVKLLAAAGLCMAVAGLSRGWASDDPSVRSARAALAEPDQAAADETPKEILFSTGWLTYTDQGVQLNLRVPEGQPEDFSGVAQVVDEGGTALITLEHDHQPGTLSARNAEGVYGNLSVRRLNITLDDIVQGPVNGHDKNGLFNDDIYRAYSLLFLTLNKKKDYLARDVMLQADRILVFSRADGSLELQLYRQDVEQGGLESLGELWVDSSRQNYQLKGQASLPEFQSQRKEILRELQALEQQMGRLDEEVMQLMESGQTAGVQAKVEEAEALKARFQQQLRGIKISTEFALYTVTETVNYEANHWLKFTDDGGMEVAAQAVSYKIMSSLVENRAARLIAETELRDMRSLVQDILTETLARRTREPAVGDGVAEGTLSYLSRKLATAWAALQGRVLGQNYEMPPMYVNDPHMAGPVVRIKGVSYYVTNSLTTENTLDEMNRVLTTPDRVKPDRFMVTEDQLREMKSALNSSGWVAWLKSFYNPAAYQPSRVANDLNEMMAYRNVDLNGLVQGSGVQGGLPVHHFDRSKGTDWYGFTSDLTDTRLAAAAREQLNKPVPQVLVKVLEEGAKGAEPRFDSEKLTPEVQQRIDNSRLVPEVQRHSDLLQQELNTREPGETTLLKAVGNQAWGTLMAAGTGMATGYVVQHGVDMASKYYNEGVAPWGYSEKEAEQQSERALHTGSMMALTAAVNYNVLPYVTQASDYFAGKTGTELMSAGLKGKFEASAAGGLSGFAAHSVSSGYQYYQGNMTGHELALDVADAAGRAIPTAIFSAIGHWALPYAFEVPYVSAFLPIGFVGAVAGSMVGNAVYDTAKHYVYQGVRAANNYLYSDSSTTVDTGGQPTLKTAGE